MSNEQKTANRIAAIALAGSLLLQSLIGAYFYGRLSERVETIQRDTRILLDMHLQKQGEAK